MAVIDYSSGPRVTNVGDHVVYTKATWAGTWVAQPNLVCTECQWRAAPDFNTAVLTWRTGNVIMPGDTTPTPFTPWTGRGYFVRIDWACEDSTTLRWVGFIDSSSWPTEAFGDQQLVCFGLERALALTPILDRAFKRSTSAIRSGIPAMFNLNRSKTADAGGVYLFNDQMRDDVADWESWSTLKIVKYLLKYHCPTSTFGVANVPWSIDQATQLPDWDTVTLEGSNRTVWDLLCELISPDKQLGFTVGSNGSTAYLRVFTHTSADITVGSSTLLANPNQHTLILSPDALTDANLSDVGGGYDQVICRGARRQTICTLKHTTQIDNDWTSTDETDYEAGASAQTGYATANTQKQREMNIRIREQRSLAKVYRDFRINKTFNWQIGSEDLFPGNTTPREIWIRDRLPIIAGIDWSGTVDPTDADRTGEGRPWQIYMAIPDALTKYLDLATISINNAETVSSSKQPTITVSAETGFCDKFKLLVHGAPQHSIAGTNFSRLPVDAPAAAWGGLDYTTLALTCALEEDRYCEGKYPSSAPSADIVRRLVVDCGPRYMQVRMHKTTIAGIDHEGTAQTVPTSAYLIDDSDKLATLAQVIALGVVLTRKRVNWSSQRRISTIAIGDMINTAEGQTVLAPVTCIRINAATSVGSPAQCPTQTFETFGGQHDPLKVLRNLGMVL